MPQDPLETYAFDARLGNGQYFSRDPRGWIWLSKIFWYKFFFHHRKLKLLNFPSKPSTSVHYKNLYISTL